MAEAQRCAQEPCNNSSSLLEPPEQPAPAPVGLHDLPITIVHAILLELTSSSSGAAGDSPAAAVAAGLRSAVRLAFSSKTLMEAVAAADPFWELQCIRLGWRCECRLLGGRRKLRHWLCSASPAPCG